MLVNNACCDGNLLLSWGPKWDGEFDAAQKARFLEVGDWLRRNGEAIYATRGGPWTFCDWGGSTRRGPDAYLHVLQWPGETLRLPAIAGRKLTAAEILGGHAVAFAGTGGLLEIAVPRALQDPLDTIVKLTFDRSLDGLPAIEAGALVAFDAPTFGGIVSRGASVTTSTRHEADPGNPGLLVGASPRPDFAFHTQAEALPWVRIDLGREVSVTGVRILNRGDRGQAGWDRAATMRLSVSRNGRDWSEVWRAASPEAAWDIPVTDYVSGAHVPGRRARYVKLELHPVQAEYFHLRQVDVWGKD
jgi:hypothetical protein